MLQVPSASRSDSTDRGYNFVTWAFRFAHQNRINFRYLHGPPIKAVEVSPHSVLPTRQVKSRFTENNRSSQLHS